MKQLYQRLPLFILAFSLHQHIQAQLFVDSMQYTPQELVMDFFNGSCVDVTSVEYFGQEGQLNFFEGSQSGLNVNAGIIFATGNVQVAVGPNNNTAASMGNNIGNPNDNNPFSDFSTILGLPGFDRSVLHLSIVPHTDSIGFKYVFGSEEYCEYVGTQFNDFFCFLVKGPGISGPYGGAENIATIPGTSTPVTINNVNHQLNTGFYINNSDSTSTQLCGQLPSNALTVSSVQFDGLTTVLIAGANVIPDSTYEVWIGISDVADGVFDSGIFLSIESLCGDTMLSPQAAFVPAIDNNTVAFQNSTKYATWWHWDFGDGSSSNLRYPVHTYDNLNQAYTVTLVAGNYCCTDTLVSVIGASASQEIRDEELRIYPTLMQDELLIEPLLELSGALQLTDLTGRVHVQQQFTGKTRISTGHLPAGVYLLNIVTNDQRSLQRKVVKG